MHNNPPGISVVIPLYNKERQIARAISSVLLQSFQDFEIIVVDDGSSDEGVNVVSTFKDSRLRLVKQVNQGVSVARNVGVSLALSELIAFLDADDAYSIDFLLNIWRMHLEYKSAVAYAMNYEMVDSEGVHRARGVTLVRDSEILLSPDNFFEIARHGSPVWSSAVAVNKSILKKVGGFPVGVKLGEDLDTWIRLLFAGPIVFNSNVGGYYYSDATIRAMQVNSPPDHYVFFDTCDEWVRKNGADSKVAQSIEEFKNFFRLTYAHFQIKNGNRLVGRLALKQCSTIALSAEKNRLLVLSFLPRSIYRLLSEINFFVKHGATSFFRKKRE